MYKNVVLTHLIDSLDTSNYHHFTYDSLSVLYFTVSLMAMKCLYGGLQTATCTPDWVKYRR